MADLLEEYRRKRDPGRTPEPVPAGPAPRGRNDTFVIQQHHARRLHWDLRLERDGVLVSWAVPRGLPREPGRNHLAVHTEDHPLEYADFHGEIPAGEYGGGRMMIHDRGTYDTEKWRDDEVMVVLHGTRTRGRYVLFQTSGRDWMVRRMDPPEPSWTPMPELIRPMLPTPRDELPRPDHGWAYEMGWHGQRAVAYVSGGRLRLLDGDDREVTRVFPELRGLAEDLAPIECVLDGEVVAFDDAGRVSAHALRPRIEAAAGDADAIRRLASRLPVQYLVYDVLWLDGQSTVDLAYEQRRELLDALAVAGANWHTPPYFVGGGRHALETARAQGLPGVVAKRLSAPYRPGERSTDWLDIPASAGDAADPAAEERAQVLVAGWRSGTGQRPGALLLAVPDGDGSLRYAGTVTAGLTRAAFDDLVPRLRRLERRTPPVEGVPPAQARAAHWVSPKLTGEVAHAGPGPDGRLRRPRWLGLR